MNNTYGFFNGKTYAVFTHATDLKGAVIIMVKRIMKMAENSPVFNSDGTFNHRQTLQNWVNDYGEVVIENSRSDNGGVSEYTIVSKEEVADHILNTFGWLTLNKTSIDRNIVYNEFVALMDRWEIKDYQAV